MIAAPVARVNRATVRVISSQTAVGRPGRAAQAQGHDHNAVVVQRGIPDHASQPALRRSQQPAHNRRQHAQPQQPAGAIHRVAQPGIGHQKTLEQIQRDRLAADPQKGGHHRRRLLGHGGDRHVQRRGLKKQHEPGDQQPASETIRRRVVRIERRLLDVPARDHEQRQGQASEKATAARRRGSHPAARPGSERPPGSRSAPAQTAPTSAIAARRRRSTAPAARARTDRRCGPGRCARPARRRRPPSPAAGSAADGRRG